MSSLVGLLLVAVFATLPTRVMADGCTIAVIPDTQKYYGRAECGNCTSNCSAFPSNPPVCTSDNDCSAWGATCVGPSGVPAQIAKYILDQRLTRDPTKPIAFVTQAGDVVDLYWQQERWLAMKTAMHSFDGIIPWSVTAGNHDGGYSKPLQFPDFLRRFNSSVYAAVKQPAGARFIESWGDWAVNSAHLFQCGSKPVLHLSIQWDADTTEYSEVIERAREIIDEHRELPVVVTIHGYLDLPGKSAATQGYTELYDAGGLFIWKNLVSVSPNIFLVNSAHRIHTLTEPAAHVRSRKNLGGGTLVETMFNAQRVGGDPNKGNGWLMFLGIDWNAQTIRFEAYSPFLNQTAAQASFPLEHMDGSIGFDLPVACSDSIDNDGDGSIDLADSECASAGDLSE
ncbi:MAG: hypothetical protein GY937_18540 [bacterium]|nr:hypothetical protein [bacterium]